MTLGIKFFLLACFDVVRNKKYRVFNFCRLLLLLSFSAREQEQFRYLLRLLFGRGA